MESEPPHRLTASHPPRGFGQDSGTVSHSPTCRTAGQQLASVTDRAGTYSHSACIGHDGFVPIVPATASRSSSSATVTVGNGCQLGSGLPGIRTGEQVREGQGHYCSCGRAGPEPAGGDDGRGDTSTLYHRDARVPLPHCRCCSGVVVAVCRLSRNVLPAACSSSSLTTTVRCVLLLSDPNYDKHASGRRRHVPHADRCRHIPPAYSCL